MFDMMVMICNSLCTCMTRYLDGSLAILENSAISSLNLGRLDGSIIQPEEGERNKITGVNISSTSAVHSRPGAGSLVGGMAVKCRSIIHQALHRMTPSDLGDCIRSSSL